MPKEEIVKESHIVRIELTQDEINIFSLLDQNIRRLEQNMARAIQGRKAYLSLLENKYSAKFDPDTGFLVPIKETEVDGGQ